MAVNFQASTDGAHCTPAGAQALSRKHATQQTTHPQPQTLTLRQYLHKELVRQVVDALDLLPVRSAALGPLESRTLQLGYPCRSLADCSAVLRAATTQYS